MESEVGDFPQPKRLFGHIHVDVVGPLPPSDYTRHLLMIVDRSTRWLEATLISKATTHVCADVLLSSSIRRFGVPDDITMDRGSAFLSEIWLSQANLMETTLHSTTAYNHAVNAMVERAHRTLKAALMARCTDEHWKAQLPWVLLGLRTAPRADGKPSPLREALTVPDEFFPVTTDDTKLDHLREISGKFRPCLKSYEDRTRHFTPKDLYDCDYVFIQVDAHRQPLTRPYCGPYEVVRRTAKSFLLNVLRQENWVTIN
ncbi:protein NYNRIN-like [Palaemon carinicauda]|uniref:protein NYNRIN-like n=1 Tax=Palaemon carinicauda TaxID=392227 RepID=UPI0035B5991E